VSSSTFKIIHSWLGHQFSETLQGYHLPKSSVLSVDDKQAIRNGTASQTLSAFMLANNGLLDIGDIDPTGISLPNHAQPFIHWYHPNMDNIKSKETTLIYGGGATLPEMSMYAKWGRRSLIIPALVPFDNNVISQATFQGVYNSTQTQYSSPLSVSASDIDGIFINSSGVPKTDIFDLTEYTSSMGAMAVISESDLASDSQQIDVLQSIGETYQASQSAPVYPMHSSGLNGKFILEDTITTYDNEDISRSQFYQNHFPMIINSTRAKYSHPSNVLSSSNYIGKIKNILSVNGSPRPVYLPASAYFYNNPVENTDNSATTSDETITNDPNAVSNELSAMKHGAGFHPAINWIGRSFSNIKSTITNPLFDTQAKRDFDFRSFPIDEDQLIYEPTIRAELETNSTFNASSDFSGLLGSETAWSTPAMRACLNTDTVAYLNLMTKTYQFTAGHDSIHPYDDDTAFSDSKTIPQWMRQSFASGFDKVPGKGVATNTDTQHVGAMGTNINTTGSSLFFDERLLGTSFYGNIGQHGSSKATAVFRDLFDFTSYNIIQAIATEKTNSLKFTPMISAFAKGGMQSKLLYNCSLRVLHSRPNNAITGQATAPRSLTELFICVDGDNNQLIQLPRTSFDKSTYKPYIHVQGVSKTLNHEYLASQENHPNHPYMKHLDNMICDTLGIGQTQSSANPYIVENGNGYNDAIPTATFLSDDPCNCDGEPLPQIKHQDYTQARNGDTFNADPFDFAWDRSLVETNTTTNAKALNPMIQGNASNSGIEYELISSLTALHSKANLVGLTSNIGASTRYTLQDLIPTANEMTLPGDHEITFVLYTGKHGQSFVEDMPETFNPAVAGCHLKATLEINRPSQYLSSSAESNIHYGKTIGGNPIQTYAIAGAKPSVLSNLRVFSVPFNYFID
ncbi:hypothetical protein EB001_17475, partial [bacterium]|nr:hypothetical protein [bacterium]